jgi:hypothetical protein
MCEDGFTVDITGLQSLCPSLLGYRAVVEALRKGLKEIIAIGRKTLSEFLVSLNLSVLKTRKLNVSETGSVSVLRERRHVFCWVP